MTALSTQVTTFFERRGIQREIGIVAVSGGPDSVALAHLVSGLGLKDLTIAHVNHRLRGEESDREQEFVADLAERLGCLYSFVEFNTQQLADEGGENLESCARRLRYQWFAELAKTRNATWIATGHTADDQAETVLHRLLRGAGLQGLAGIPEVRSLTAGIEVIRPLLQCRRSDVRLYLEEIREGYCTDSSNQDMRFTRNRIRHELLPMLMREYNPDIVDILCRLAHQAAGEHEQQRAAAAELLETAELPRAGKTIVLLRQPLVEAGRERARELFRLLFERENWPQGDMTFEAWDRLAALAERETGAIDLPAGVCARSRGRVVQMLRTDAV